MNILLGALNIPYLVIGISFAKYKHLYPKDTFKSYPKYPEPISTIEEWYICYMDEHGVCRKILTTKEDALKYQNWCFS